MTKKRQIRRYKRWRTDLRKKNLHFTEWEFELQDHPDQKVEINGCRVLLQNGSTINITNVYNANGNNSESGGNINELSTKIPANEQLIITGDFNAHNTVC